jgi:hypothetical protein
VSDGTDLKGRRGIYLIDTATGATSLFMPASGPTRPRNPHWSSDGRAVRYQQASDGQTAMFERQIGSEISKEIFRGPGVTSPDGQFVGYIESDATASTFMVRPVSGGKPQALLAGPAGSLTFRWQWLPDSKGAILLKEPPTGGGAELWMAMVAGRSRKLDIDVRQWDEGLFRLHPDGRQIAFVARAGEPGAEVWALENFLPAATAKK